MALCARLAAVASAMALSFGCAAVDSDGVAQDLARGAAGAGRGVAKIAHALSTLEPTSRGFGEGVREVERATRELAALETDERASEAQRLQAMVLQARAWDDTAQVIDAAGDGNARPSVIDALREKSFPARIAARNSFDRAFRAACSSAAAEDPAVMLEIIDGIARNGGPAESACP